MRDTIDINAARAASEKKRFTEIKVNMVMHIYDVSRVRALEILAERTTEKAAAEAVKAAEKAAREAERAAEWRRVAEWKEKRRARYLGQLA